MPEPIDIMSLYFCAKYCFYMAIIHLALKSLLEVKLTILFLVEEQKLCAYEKEHVGGIPP